MVLNKNEKKILKLKQELEICNVKFEIINVDSTVLVIRLFYFPLNELEKNNCKTEIIVGRKSIQQILTGQYKFYNLV